MHTKKGRRMIHRSAGLAEKVKLRGRSLGLEEVLLCLEGLLLCLVEEFRCQSLRCSRSHPGCL